MSTDINSVTIVGRLTRNPEVRHTGGGMPIVNFGVAFNSRHKADGEWTDKANFCDVKGFGERMEKLAGWVGKGSRIAVRGRLDYQQWESNGTKRSKLEIIADDIQTLDSKKDSENLRQQQDAAAEAPDVPPAVSGGHAQQPDDGDDIPW